MSKSRIKSKMGFASSSEALPEAFTFVEVIIALAIVSISLLALIRLHITSVNMVASAETTSQAVLLAEEKIAETLAAGYPDEGDSSGTIQKNELSFDWQTRVTDIYLPQLGEAHTGGLREVSVDINWKQAAGKKHLQMSTYVADGKLK